MENPTMVSAPTEETKKIAADWKKNNEREIRWKHIQSLIGQESRGRGRELSDTELVRLIQLDEDRDWDTLEDIGRLGVNGYFVCSASNIEKHIVVEIKNGKITDEDYKNIFAADGGTDHGNFFEDYHDALEHAEIAENGEDEDDS
jgi:hypothetical protein